jgi:GTPase SAR1 family protein
MACCGAGLSDDQKLAIQESSKLDKVLTAQQVDEGKIIKLLLLGTGESGKSTIFKQMQILYQEGFSDFEKSTFRHVVRRNVVEAMQTLLHGCEKFGFHYSSHGSAVAAKFMVDLDPLAADFWQGEIVGYVKELWRKERALRQAFEIRSKLQLLDSAEYLFENIERIGNPDFTPNKDDILRARLRTSGIVERMFKIKNVDFKFLDVGGQRNERRKWIHCFEGVTAVIFVAAISEYDQVLYEDEKGNRKHEAVRVFDNICNSKYFSSTAMILFLNKQDLFEDKIKRVSLRVCFPEYRGSDSFDEASEYIKAKFVEVNKLEKMVFCHLTCATDTGQVERVFEACKLVILKGNLEKLGLSD